jgi:hypothetical protein
MREEFKVKVLAVCLVTLTAFSFSGIMGMLGSVTPTVRFAPTFGAVNDYNWAGYAIPSSPNSVTFVMADWVVPKVSGPANSYSGIWIGIDGYVYNSYTVEQIGTSQNISSSGTAEYNAWYEMVPLPPVWIPSSRIAISPGDTINAEIWYSPVYGFQLEIWDITSGGWIDTYQVNTNALRSSAEWVVESPMTFNGKTWVPLPLADFGTVTFTACEVTIGGHTSYIGGFSYDTLTMITTSGIVRASPSALSGYGGSSFTVTWYHY